MAILPRQTERIGRRQINRADACRASGHHDGVPASQPTVVMQ